MVIHTSWRRKLLQNKSYALAIVGLFHAFALAFIDTIWSLYLDSFFHNVSYVGFFSAGLTLLAVIFYFFSSYLLGRAKEGSVLLLSVLGLCCGYIVFYFTQSIGVLVFASVLMVFFAVLRRISMGLLIRDNARPSIMSEIVGFEYVLENIGWLLGPLIAGFFAAFFGVRIVFLLSILFLMFGFIFFKTIHPKNLLHNKDRTSVLHSIVRGTRLYFSNKKLTKLYFVSGGIKLFWALTYIYVPLFMIREGLSEIWIGFFFFGIILPLVLFEYYWGKFTDRYSFNVPFVLGYFIIGFFCVLAAFSINIYWVMLFLVLAAIGTSFLEGTTEAYFFKTAPERNVEKMYGVYSTTDELFNTFGRLLFAFLLLFLPENIIYVVTGIIMFLCMGVAISLQRS